MRRTVLLGVTAAILLVLGAASAFIALGEAGSDPVAGRELEVVLVLDTSGSMEGEAMEAAKESASGVLEQLPADTRVAVVAFDTTARLISALTADLDAHRAAIAPLLAEGHTTLYDGIALGLRQFTETGTDRAVVVLSDGADTRSVQTLDAVTAGVAGSGATLHVVELETTDTDSEALAALAAAAGSGRHITTGDPQGLGALFDTIAAELRGSPPPTATTVWDSSWSLGAGAGMLFLALLLLFMTVLHPRRGTSSLAVRPGTGGERQLPGMTSLANRTTHSVERGLKRRGWMPSVNGALERAGISLRAGEYITLAGSIVVVAFAVGLLVQGALTAVLLAGAVTASSVVGVRTLAARRRARFTDQLGVTLQLMAGTLRAGYGLLQSIDAVAREAESPTAEEFRRIVVETRLGRDLEESLHAMDRRVGSEDLLWVVQALAIHQEVGGDLAQVLDAVAGTIRERNQIRRQVSALSAEGKLSAVILFAMPFALAGFLVLTNPSYLGELVTDPIGWAMLAVTGVLLGLGGVWLRRIVRLVF
ncbi:MAG: type II secretion system F family protein [Egibacteraceae bacterium]